jgi:CheY-like chemotaxis protein
VAVVQQHPAPAARGDLILESERLSAMGPTHGTSQILLVDDDEFHHEMVKAAFGETRARLLQAFDGDEARNLLDRHADEICLIVTDLNMPGTDGIEFLEILKNRNCRIPVVIVSGADSAARHSAQVLATAYGLDLLAVLAKPLKPGDLLDLATPHLAKPDGGGDTRR